LWQGEKRPSSMDGYNNAPPRRTNFVSLSFSAARSGEREHEKFDPIKRRPSGTPNPIFKGNRMNPRPFMVALESNIGFSEKNQQECKGGVFT